MKRASCSQAVCTNTKHTYYNDTRPCVCVCGHKCKCNYLCSHLGAFICLNVSVCVCVSVCLYHLRSFCWNQVSLPSRAESKDRHTQGLWCVCVCMCLCIYSFGQVHNPPTHIYPSAFHHCPDFICVYVSVSHVCLCVSSPEPTIGLFQTEMLNSNVFFLSPLWLQLTCQWPWPNKTTCT